MPPADVWVMSCVQVSPWGTRQLLLALTVDCAVLEELKATNYSLLVLVCPGMDALVLVQRAYQGTRVWCPSRQVGVLVKACLVWYGM